MDGRRLPSTCGACVHVERGRAGAPVCMQLGERVVARNVPPVHCPLRPSDDTPVVHVPILTVQQRIYRFLAELEPLSREHGYRVTGSRIANGEPAHRVGAYLLAVEALQERHDVHLIGGEIEPGVLAADDRYALGLWGGDSAPVEVVRRRR